MAIRANKVTQELIYFQALRTVCSCQCHSFIAKLILNLAKPTWMVAISQPEF